MAELLRVRLLRSDIRTCFFYKNSFDSPRESYDGVRGIEMRHGRNFELIAYGSICLNPLRELPDGYLGVSPLLADKLKLKENDQVLISSLKSPSLKSLEISPKREEDYIILLSCKSFIESNLLNQVRVVSEGQTLPLHIFSNIVVDIQIGRLKPQGKHGQLERLTEVSVLHKMEVETHSQNDSGPASPGDETSTDSLKWGRDSSKFLGNLNRKLLSTIQQVKHVNEERRNCLPFQESANQNKYKILPSSILPVAISKQILDKFIFLPNAENISKVESFGSHSIKVLCRVENVIDDAKRGKSMESPRDLGSSETKAQSSNEQIYCYAVSFSDVLTFPKRDNVAFCPLHVMKNLKISAGSWLKIEKVKTRIAVENLPGRKEAVFHFEEDVDFFPANMTSIKENIINKVIDNLRMDCKLNTLVIGGLGTGKTHLINSLVKWHESQFIFTKLVSCKRLRGKKLETLCKIMLENLIACCKNEPATLFLDDLNALTQFDEDEEKFNRLYSERVNAAVSGLIETIQEKYKVFVVATSTGLRELGNLVSTRGPSLFPNVQKVSDLSAEDRLQALKYLIEHKNKSVRKSFLDFSNIAGATNGYTIQDLSDLIDKAAIKCFVAGIGVAELSQADFDSALSEFVPLFLRGTTDNKKTKNAKIWNEIGGLSHPKKVLKEVFSWPSKYPDLLKSCPLRLQKGVLLYGAPGTGKTLLAKALANECDLNFMSVKGPELLSKYVGASEEGVRNLFVQAQKKQPCLLFFDEFEGLAPKRGHDSTGVTDRVVNQLLTQLDGVEGLSGVWILAATSRPDLIDPALLRPGRLDKIVLCEVPTRSDRVSILEALSKNLPKSEDVDLAEIARMTEGYTGADLQAVLTHAQISVMKIGEKTVKQKDLVESLRDTRPSLSNSERLLFANIYEKFLSSRKKSSGRSYREMGQKTMLA